MHIRGVELDCIIIYDNRSGFVWIRFYFYYTTKKGMIRMPRKRRSTKSRIVKAAWNLFYKNGYEQTTIETSSTLQKLQKVLFIIISREKEPLLNSLSYLLTRNTKTFAAVIDPNLLVMINFYF